MMNSGYCQQHGQYQVNASGACPYCAQVNQVNNPYLNLNGGAGSLSQAAQVKIPALDEIIRLLKKISDDLETIRMRR